MHFSTLCARKASHFLLKFGSRKFGDALAPVLFGHARRCPHGDLQQRETSQHLTMVCASTPQAKVDI
jgi:hypothetical protein